MNVVGAVVARGLCSGCGVCAAACPEERLVMDWNAAGELVAKGGDCRSNCGRCLAVCPFAAGPDEDELALGFAPGARHRPETGWWRAAVAGRATPAGHAATRSSGGMATAFLAGLLEAGAVERVVSVAPCHDGDRLFRFAVMERPEEVRASARSCYYPVELSGALARVRELPGRSAVIGLPCMVTAIRRWQRLDPALAERLPFVAGLVCGGTRSRQWAGYLCALGGGNPAELAEVDFRHRGPGRPAREYGFRFRCRDGAEGTVGAVVRNAAWARRWFQPEACDCCDDIFAECADAVFMDAWSPGREGGFALLRSRAAAAAFDELVRGGRVEAGPVAIDEVVAAQHGLVRLKRAGLAERLALNPCAPRRRVAPRLPSTPRRPALALARLERRVVARAFAACGGRMAEFQRRTLAVRTAHRLSRLGLRACPA